MIIEATAIWHEFVSRGIAEQLNKLYDAFRTLAFSPSTAGAATKYRVSGSIKSRA